MISSSSSTSTSLRRSKRKNVQIDFADDHTENDEKEISKRPSIEYNNNNIDTMGCDQCYDTDIIISDKQKRFQILVALMLSSQTKDQITYAAMNRLRQHNLSIEFIDKISCNELMQLIKPVGFYRRKAEYLKQTAKILMEKYDSDIPETIDELKKLPGVGPKMAHLTMITGWNQLTGIAVDTHVHRISNRLQWTTRTKQPEQTRKQLEKWLPKNYWNKINHLFVGFGQTICLPIKPKCNICLNNHLCPSSSTEF
ncbi:Endonuclease III-like protein 1 [Dermatophagoides pteronyssinus]|uniref:Endonuclease III homolog n=1 Tax=Dermatophagoides pteronyssinus TaxID=6956 RepID=A0ABQ8J492_DERPT|nr:Endonuclease III-like protein 1 [Dermatophagoides pteronyssinus]